MASMTSLTWMDRAKRAHAAADALGLLWTRIRADGIDLPLLLDLRAQSRAYSYDCPDLSATDLAMALENAAEALFRDRERTDPGRPRELIVREIDALVERIRATAAPAPLSEAA